MTKLNAAPLQIALLGRFEIQSADNTFVQLAYDKGRALLCYLACQAGVEKPRSQLAQLFWPDLPREAGLTNLRLVLHDLRQKLMQAGQIEDLVISNRTHLGFNSKYQHLVDVCQLHDYNPDFSNPTDSDVFSLCHARINSYQGHLLEHHNLENCDEFDEWLTIQREASLRKVLALIEKLSHHYQLQANYPLALQLAYRYVELDPWNEAAHRLVMRLHMANQQKTTALAHYDHCKRVLRQELGVEPAQATQQLAQLISSDDYQDEAASQELSRLERRQITVLCCDFHAQHDLDPELQWEQLQAPREACLSLLSAASAFVVEHQGSSILAYFGYPQAQEFAARLAIDTGLKILQLNFASCQFSLGINTGAILIESQAKIPEPIGSTSELALRLRLIAEPGELVISRQTQLLTQGYFTFIDLGEQKLRGIRQTLHAYRILERNQVYDRLQTTPQLSPFIGRQQELAIVNQYWQASLQGAFCVLAIHAEAGLGKSRLVHEFLQQIPDQEMNFLILRGLPELQQRSYAPFIYLLEQQLGWQEHTDAEQKWRQLAEYAALITPDDGAESLLTLASLLQLPLPAGQPDYPSAPQKLRQRVIDLALHRIRSLSEEATLILYLEDLHWFDASSLEIIQLLLQQNERSLFMLVSSRTPLPEHWQDHIKQTAIQFLALHLPALANAETCALVQQINPALSTDSVARICQQSDGIPLFAEEISKFFDADMLVPQTLHDLLASRLEGLGEARFVAQTAASLGREFDLNLLQRCVGQSQSKLLLMLEQLSRAQIILQVRPQAYRFKHALIRDAAYQTQSKQSQRETHAQIAQVLQQQVQETGLPHPELLAYHFKQAQHYDMAIHYGFEAGMASLKLFANREALDQFELALQLCDFLDDVDTRNSWRLRLLLQIFTCQRTLYGYGSELANTSLEQAILLSDQQSDHPYLFQAIWNIWSSSSTRSGYLSSLHWAQKLLEIAERHQDPVQLEQAWYTMCNTLMWLGQLHDARGYAEKLMQHYQSAHDTAHRQLFAENPYINAGSHLAWILWFNGEIDQAMRLSDEMVSVAEEIQHPYSLCFALCFASVLRRWAGMPHAALELSERGIQLSNQHGYALWQAACVMVHGWAAASLGNPAGLVELNASIDAMRKVMGGVAIGFLTPLADALVSAADYAAALPVLAEALQVASHISDGHALVELLRLQALCHGSGLAQIGLAQSLLAQAQELALEQGNHALGLRVAINQLELAAGTPAALACAEALQQAMQRLYCTDWSLCPDLGRAHALLERIATSNFQA